MKHGAGRSPNEHRKRINENRLRPKKHKRFNYSDPTCGHMRKGSKQGDINNNMTTNENYYYCKLFHPTIWRAPYGPRAPWFR